MAAVISAAVDAWHSRGSASSAGSDWLGDSLDGGPLVRLVLSLSQLLDADGGAAQPARLLAWLNRSADGWTLWDASGHLEAALEGQPPSSWGENECVLLSTAFIVVEGGRAAHLAGAAPARVYVAFHAGAVEHVPELIAEPPRWRYSGRTPDARPASVQSLLRWDIAAPLPSGSLSVTGRVVGECLRSYPHITGVQTAAAPPNGQAPQGARLRLRDLQGRDVVDIFMDQYRKRLPPGEPREPGSMMRACLSQSVCRRRAWRDCDCPPGDSGAFQEAERRVSARHGREPVLRRPGAARRLGGHISASACAHSSCGADQPDRLC